MTFLSFFQHYEFILFVTLYSCISGLLEEKKIYAKVRLTFLNENQIFKKIYLY